jgi:hypothetical protein
VSTHCEVVGKIIYPRQKLATKRPPFSAQRPMTHRCDLEKRDRTASLCHDLYKVEVELTESIWLVGEPTLSPLTWAFVEVMGFEPTASTLRNVWLSVF